jgi:two-component system sensor histidine kinase UhpB
MSLRFRLILSVALMLLISVTLGGGLAWLHAIRSVATEMDAALVVGEHTVQTVIPFIGSTPDVPVALHQLISTFDGDRHLRATLTDKDGEIVARSFLAVPPAPVPKWFARAVGRTTPSAKLALSGHLAGGSIVLETDPQNELTEVWTEFGDNIKILAVFVAFTFPMIYWTLGWALRPLDQVSRAFHDVGPSVSPAHIEVGGPPELVELARGFNTMVDRLALFEASNRRLHEQLSTIQEDERAELARDLHDEIGPHLFAMGVDAAAIQKMAEARGLIDIVAEVQLIREGVTHIQHHVRGILGRLRSGGLMEFGLQQALENLTAFWRSRHPQVAISVKTLCADQGYGESFDGVVYRIVQESLSNAMRHGKPRRVEITIDARSELEAIVEVSDDGGGLKWSGETLGFGLRGMAERVTALGGHLEIRDRAGAPGVTVTARLPLPEGSRTVAA